MTGILLGLLVFWNLVVFLTYMIDKWKAKHQRWRISENLLLGMSLFAGGLGALLAGKVIRHKTRKWYFWLAWIVGVIIDALLIYGIFTYIQ